MTKATTRGIGRDANPIDGDHIVVEVGVRDGRIVSVGAQGIVTGRMTTVGDVSRSVWFKTGAEARAQGNETFGGCETARSAALVLHMLFIGRSVDEGLAIGMGDVLTKMGGTPGESGRCVLAVLGAVRSALIDAHVAALAEATVDVHRLRVK